MLLHSWLLKRKLSSIAFEYTFCCDWLKWIVTKRMFSICWPNQVVVWVVLCWPVSIWCLFVWNNDVLHEKSNMFTFSGSWKQLYNVDRYCLSFIIILSKAHCCFCGLKSSGMGWGRLPLCSNLSVCILGNVEAIHITNELRVNDSGVFFVILSFDSNMFHHFFKTCDHVHYSFEVRVYVVTLWI